MEILVILVVLDLNLRGVLRVSACQNNPSSDREVGKKPRIPIPKLPLSYEAHIEANIMEMNYTVDITEYSDKPNNRASIFLTKNGTTTQKLISFKNKVIHEVNLNSRECFVSFMKNLSSNIYQFKTSVLGSHVTGLQDILNYVSDTDYWYMGTSMVRGILVDHWSSCLHIDSSASTYDIDVFFTNGSHITGSGLEKVPIRIVINRTDPVSNRDHMNATVPRVQRLTHYYDFVSFRLGIRDESVFEIPLGLYCSWHAFSKYVPFYALQISFEMETLTKYLSGPIVSLVTEKVYYDKASKIVRIDVNNAQEKVFLQQYGSGDLSIVQDYNVGLQYVLDTINGNCTVSNITDLERYTQFGNTAHLTILEMIYTLSRKLKYQGQKTYRHMLTEAWAKYYPHNQMVQEIYIKNPDLPLYFGNPIRCVKVFLFDIMDRLVIGMYVGVPIFALYTGRANRTTQGKVQIKTEFAPPRKEDFTNIYNLQESKLDPDVFNVRSCYDEGYAYRDLQFSIELLPLDAYRNNRKVFLNNIQQTLRRVSDVSPTRITGLRITSEDTDPVFTAHFTLLAPHSRAADVSGKVKPQPSLKQAFGKLKQRMNNGGLGMKVLIKTKTPTLIKAYVFVLTSLEASDSNTMSSTIKSNKCKTGTMVGVGVLTSFFGLTVGLVVALLIYRKVKSVPYSITQ